MLRDKVLALYKAKRLRRQIADELEIPLAQVLSILCKEGKVVASKRTAVYECRCCYETQPVLF